jgi:hypothetical protein
LDTGRRPFLINIGGGIPVPSMGRATAWTGPQPIAQGHGIVDEATDMTAFGGREKAVDVVYMGAELLSSLMQDLYKAPKAHIGDLASPPW